MSSPPRASARPYVAPAIARSSSGVAERANPAQRLAIFGAQLKARRLAAELTQAGLAERAELDVSYVSQLERGLRDPSLSSMESLAGALGMSVSAFLDDGASDPLLSQTRALAQELSALDEASRRDAVEILRRFQGAIARTSARRRR